ncbi:MAG: PAS domain S-box protein, partial [Desulfovibrionaceae bacterium]|nr:PAS domain S-box protein [Desulfovibrionaceae bacterium]
RLILIVLAALVPCGVYAYFTYGESVKYARIEAVEDARRLAILTAGNGRELFDGGHRLLAAIGQLPRDVLLDQAKCGKFFESLLADNSSYANFALADAKGLPVCSSLPVPDGLSVEGNPWFTQALLGKDFVISDPLFCRIAKKPAIIMSAPVRGESGKVSHVLALTMESGWLERIAAGLPLPEGTTLSVVDRAGKFWARYPQAGDWLEKPIPGSDAILAAVTGGGPDTAEAVGVDGVERLYAFAPLFTAPGAEMFMRIGIPARVAYAQAEKSLRRNLLVIASVGALAILATAVFGNIFILRHTNVLLTATKRLASGDMSFRIGGPHSKGELAQIARSFDIMADSLDKQAADLKQAEENYRSIFENATEGIFRTNPRGSFILANPTLAKIFGYESAAELLDAVKDIGAQLYVEPQKRREVIGELELRGSVSDFEFEAYRKDGSKIWLSLSVRAVRGDRGGVVYMEGFAMDITRRKQAEAQLTQSTRRKAKMALKLASKVMELRAARKAAEQANRAKSDFLARMSHEIRTPIHAVLGLTDAALHTALSAEQRDYLETVRESGGALLNLINDILDFSKIEARKLRLENIDFDLREVVYSTVRTMSASAKAKGLCLDLDFAAEVPRVVKGDPARLRQILVNLVGNAVKFTAQGGVSITVGLDGLDALDRGRDGAATVLFEVRDTGEGMDQDRLAGVFDEFCQSDDSISRKYGGSGLGLSISKQLVEMMHGRIWAHSEPGSGSVFSFTAEFAKGEAANIVNAPAPPEAAAASRPLNVLLVEDNPINVKVGLSYLRRMGHACTVADSGRQAIRTLSDFRFDAVLMDLEMPDMDGFETTRRIRAGEAGEAGKSVAIIALTAHAVADYKARCLAAGM